MTLITNIAHFNEVLALAENKFICE